MTMKFEITVDAVYSSVGFLGWDWRVYVAVRCARLWEETAKICIAQGHAYYRWVALRRARKAARKYMADVRVTPEKSPTKNKDHYTEVYTP